MSYRFINLKFTFQKLKIIFILSLKFIIVSWLLNFVSLIFKFTSKLFDENFDLKIINSLDIQKQKSEIGYEFDSKPAQLAPSFLLQFYYFKNCKLKLLLQFLMHFSAAEQVLCRRAQTAPRLSKQVQTY